MHDEYTIPEAVDNGFTAFDNYFGPTWIDDIDVDALETSSLDRCPVSQLLGSYTGGLAILSEFLNEDIVPEWYGFEAVHVRGEEYDALDAEWTRRIVQARRG